jgi:hypothetical protein
MTDYDDTCSSCKQEYDFQPETPLNLYLGYLRATNISATCPHCQTEQLIFIAYDSIMRFSEHEQVKVLVFYNPMPNIAERADKVWERYGQAKELPEIPREWARALYDDLREFGGQS